MLLTRLLACAAFLGFAAMAFLLWTMPPVIYGVLGAFVGGAVLALSLGAFEAAHAMLIGVAVLGPLLVPGLGAMWPLPSVVTLLAYGALLRTMPRLRASATFPRRGELDRTTSGLMLAFVASAAIALVVWRFASGVDMTRYRAFIPPGIPTWSVFVLIVPAATLNAVYEETVWRGALWETSRAAFGDAATLVLTSLSFGLQHYHGFPSGFIGVGLATIYGFMMGVLRLRTRGLFWPCFAHTFADVVIFTLVAAMIV